MDYVIDASVIVNLILRQNSALQSKIDVVLNNANTQLFSHILLTYEVTNALRYSQAAPALIELCLDTYFQLPIKMLNTSAAIFKSATQIATSINETTYDTTYHALALGYNMTYITCDAKYYNRARHIGRIELIRA